MSLKGEKVEENVETYMYKKRSVIGFYNYP